MIADAFARCGSLVFGDRGPHTHTGNMTKYRNYWIYSIGCFVVWGVLSAVVAAQGKSDKKHTILLVFAGWVIAWVSGTIARSSTHLLADGSHPVLKHQENRRWPPIDVRPVMKMPISHGQVLVRGVRAKLTISHSC